MSIADKIRNIYLEKKNLKRVLKDAGSDIDNDTLFADYPEKIDEAYKKRKFYDEDRLELIRLYYSLRPHNHAWFGSSIDIIDLTPFPFDSNVNFSNYFNLSSTKKIILPQQDFIVNTLENVFNSCKQLESIENLEYLKVDSVTTTVNCFNGCESLESLDLSTWELRYVNNVTDMFKDCISLKELDLRNVTLVNDLESKSLFANVRNLERLRLDNCPPITALYLINHLYEDNYETGAVSPCVIYINQDVKDRALALNLPFVFMIV